MTLLNKLGAAGVAAAATLAVNVGAAQALAIVESQNYSTSASFSTGSNSSSSITGYMNDGSGNNLTFSQFDPSLGTLDFITFGITSTFVGGASANFRDDDFGQETKGLMRMQGMEVSFSMASFSGSHSKRDIEDTCSDGLNLGGASCSTAISFSDLQPEYVQLSSSVDPFIGTGDLVMSISQYGSVYFDETDGDDGYVNSRSGNLSTRGTVTVVYNYTAAPPPPPPPSATVPEPATLALFGLGLAGLGLSARRRKTL